MSQGNDFASYTASADAGATGAEDVWFVAVASDDIKQMNVDQLDEAFRLGIITAETAVWTEGMEAWAPLGEVADLDSDGASSGSPSEQEAEAEGNREYAETAANREYHAHAQEAAGRAAQAAMQSAAMQSATSQSYASARGAAATPFLGSVTMQSAQHGYAAGPSSVAPVTSSYAPSGSSSNLGQSTGPVALNVDEDMPPIRHGRRFRPERWLLVAAAVGGIGVTAYNNSDLFSSSVAQADTRAAAAPTLAARPYEEGAGVNKGASLSDSKADSEGEPAAAKAVDPGTDAPIGSNAAPGAAPKAAAPEEDAEPVAKAAAVAPGKDSLKGSFSKAFTTKKAAAAKPAKTKPRKPASRAVSKSSSSKASSKKAGVPRAASAFDPLNGSLP